MSIMKLIGRVEAAIRLIGLVAAMILLPALICVRVFEIYVRNVLDKTSSLYSGMESELLILFVFFSIAATYVGNGHVRVDILRERLSPRARAWTEIVGSALLVLPLTAVVFWYGSVIIGSLHAHGERSALFLGAPLRWLIACALPFGIGMFALAVLMRMLRGGLFLLGRAGDPEARP